MPPTHLNVLNEMKLNDMFEYDSIGYIYGLRMSDIFIRYDTIEEFNVDSKTELRYAGSKKEFP